MNTLKQFLITRWQSGYGKMLLAFAVAALIQNYPSSIAWLPKDTQAMLATAAYHVLHEGVVFLLMFVKPWNQTGGLTPITKEAEKRTIQ